MMIMIIALFLLLPFQGFSQESQEYKDTFNFSLVNRISGNTILQQNNSTIQTKNMTILELTYGTSQGFFYSGFRFAVPLVNTYKDQSIQQLQDTTVGVSIGNGYSFILGTNNPQKHSIQIITTLTFDFSIYNTYFALPKTISEKTFWGTELLLRYHYRHKNLTFIIGWDTSVHFSTEKKDSEYQAIFLITFGGILGIKF